MSKSSSQPSIDRDYEEGTRDHYRNEVVARDYARRLRFAESPVDWILTRLEIRAIRKALKRLPERRQAVMLDLPAGTGKLSKLLQSSGSLVIGADISSEMLSFAPYPCKLITDATAIPLRDSSCDVLVSLRLLHRVPSVVQDAIILEAGRVAKQGIVMTYASTPRSRRVYRLLHRILRNDSEQWLARSPADIESVLRRAGCEVLVDRSLTAGLLAGRYVAARVLS